MTIQGAINYYKNNFSKCWEDEKYKWVALQHFRNHWNINAGDFAAMLEESLGQTYNLLQGGMYYAGKMVCALARQDPEKMRGLFRMLFDESLPLVDRLQPFRTGCDELMEAFRQGASDPEKAKNHYQDLRALCVYLSFEYPEKYYLFKYRIYTDFRKLINWQETSQEKDSEIRKYENYASMCQAVVNEINADSELKEMQTKQIESEADCYSDPEFHLLAQTIIYVNCERTKKPGEKPEIGAAVADEDIEVTHYWMYSPGNNAKLWNECYKGGFMAIEWDEIGDLRSFNSKDDMKQAMKEKIDPTKAFTNAAHATWQFVHEMKPGDIIFAKKGMYTIVGRGIVESEYIFDPQRKHFKNVRKVKWTHKGEWPHPGQAVMKTLTDVTAYTDYLDKLNSLFKSETVDDAEEQDIEYPIYDAEKFLSEVYMDEDSYSNLVELVEKKKNVILQGAPGVGKTYVAKRLAYSMMGEKDPSRVKMVQFHQSYSYEDFIMGFRPSETGFGLKYGAFYNFCKTAEIDSENKYFFIIDEINRGNLSKIFGELLMLIENDKRGIELQLLYSDEKFSVPSNVYIIGMMNTADRSLAMLDYALRRRFAFFDMKPGFKTEGFRNYRIGLGSDKFSNLISCVEELNDTISRDESLGEGFCIGHSYFCGLVKATDQTLSSIVEYELIPLLKEYWFDEPVKVKEWSDKLRSSVK